MNKFMSLLKAMMSQDMNIFRIKSKKKNSPLGDLALPLALTLLVLYAVGSMYFPVAIELDKVNLMHILLTLSIFFPSLLLVFEGMYKTQSILFASKDTELLFSLPISKKRILLARIIKLYVFQFAYSLLFAIPGFAIYAFYEKPSAYFYVITALFLVLLPIIPTVSACLIGFFTKKFSVRFKAKRAVELAITFAVVIAIMIASFNMQSIIQNFIEDAENIDAKLCTIYSPIYFYKELVKEFNIINVLILFAMNALVIGLFLIVTNKSYFKVASKNAEKIADSSKGNGESKPISYKQNSQMKALVIKEFKKYFSSTVYVFNTMFGLILLIFFTVSFCARLEDIVTMIAEEEATAEQIAMVHNMMPGFYMAGVVALSFMTIITASSISIEGKSFYISKTLPIEVDKILLSKLIMSNTLTIPVIIICDLIFSICFRISPMYFIMILLLSFIAPSISAIYGLLINLRYPKMDASSDAEVVKQSKSTMVATLGGIIIAGFLAAVTVVMAMISTIALAIEVLILALILLALWFRLKKVGKKRFREIEV